MIFSLQKFPSGSVSINFEGDIFCFFSAVNAVDATGGSIINCLLSSLRLKRNILLLKRNITALPQINQAKRWDSGENWLWISPRTANELSNYDVANSPTFVLIHNFLSIAK